MHVVAYQVQGYVRALPGVLAHLAKCGACQPPRPEAIPAGRCPSVTVGAHGKDSSRHTGFP